MEHKGRKKTTTAEELAAILARIKADPMYIENIEFGKRRRGHPEGAVRAHIAELEQNLKRIRNRITELEYWKLMLLIHVHDTFKKTAVRGVPISHPNSHASLAAEFLSRYVSDRDLITMVQYHDEPYAIWQKTRNGGLVDSGRLNALIERISDWNLFLAFNLVDGCTMGKERDKLYWLFSQVEDRVASSFTVHDIF